MPDQPAKSPKIKLEELMALNDEMIALVQAGVPLELGLAEWGEDRTGELGRLSQRLADRLNQGQSLPEALTESGLPRAYRVIVEAGLRAGRLTVALEGLSKMAWRMGELRRRIGLALVYPMIVMMMAYVMFLFLTTYVIPRLQYIFSDMGLGSQSLEFFTWFWWAWLSWAIPVLVVLFVIWWWWSSRRGMFSDDGTPAGLARFCPGVGRVGKLYQSSRFADLLALLLEHDVPLPEAILLAAETGSDPAMRTAARTVADATSRGLALPSGIPASSGFSPFLHWLITRREEQKGLVLSLRAAADMYRRRAILITDWIQVAFPVMAAVLIGGGATLVYTLTLFLPLTELLETLSNAS